MGYAANMVQQIAAFCMRAACCSMLLGQFRMVMAAWRIGDGSLRWPGVLWIMQHRFSWKWLRTAQQFETGKVKMKHQDFLIS